MAVGDFYRATFIQAQHGQQLQTVVHYREDANGIGAGDTLLAGVLDAAYAANIVPLLSDEWAYQSTMVQRFRPLPPSAAVVVNTSAAAGGVPGNALPTTNSLVIRKRTANAGRRYRGRIYQGGIPFSAEIDSQVTAFFRTSVVNGWIALYTQYTTSGFTFSPVLYHPDLVSFSYITSFDGDLVLRVQRRREVGKGV